MRETEWKFDFESLPYWDNRYKEGLWGIYDEFCEIPNSDTLCCIYSILEASMCSYVGFLAILRNKENPHLALNMFNGINFKQDIYYNSKGNLIFLKGVLYDSETRRQECPIIIVDLDKNAFSFYKTNNFNPCYDIMEINDDVFGIKADEYQMKNDKRLTSLSKKKIKIHKLKWYDFSQADNIDEKVFAEKKLFGII